MILVELQSSEELLRLGSAESQPGAKDSNRFIPIQVYLEHNPVSQFPSYRVKLLEIIPGLT